MVIDTNRWPIVHPHIRKTGWISTVSTTSRCNTIERTLVSVEALVLARAVAWWNEALLGAKAAAEPAERKRTAVESFMVSI